MKKTVMAVITPMGEGGIGVIQVAGSSALQVVGEIFVSKRFGNLEMCVNNQLVYGVIHDADNNPIDEIIINIYRGDGADDLLEINCHGGVCVVNKIIDILAGFGVWQVRWQEFISNIADLRRNLFPEMDLIRKEALELIPNIKTRLGAKVLLDQYNGALSRQLFKIIKKLDDVALSLNVNDLTSDDSYINADILIILSDIKGLLTSFDFGKALIQPENIVIIGRPNVGKSSLINNILGKDRVLVHHEPGTTRDPVSEFISMKGIPLQLIDTAGLRETNNIIEKKSIEITNELMLKVNTVILVFDSACQIKKEDISIVKSLCSGLKSRGGLYPDGNYVRLIPVLNKSDLPKVINEHEIIELIGQSHNCFRISDVVRLSTVNNTGGEKLEDMMVVEFDDFIEYRPERAVLFTERQFNLLTEAYEKLSCFLDSITGKTGISPNLIEVSKHIVYNCIK